MHQAVSQARYRATKSTGPSGIIWTGREGEGKEEEGGREKRIAKEGSEGAEEDVIGVEAAGGGVHMPTIIAKPGKQSKTNITHIMQNSFVYLLVVPFFFLKEHAFASLD